MLIKCCLSTGQVKRGKKYLKWKYCKEQISYIVTTYDQKKTQEAKKPLVPKKIFQYQQSLQSVFSIIIIIIIMAKTWLRASSIKDSSNCQGDRLQYYAASAPCINHRQCLKSSRRDHATSQDLKFLLPKLYIIL